MMGIFWFKGYFKEGDPPALVIATIPISLFLFAWLYFALQESSPYLGTWGKRKFGILVCDKSLNKITFAKATGRFWAKYLTVSTYGVGFLLYFFTNRKQTLHDLICKTIVINNNN